MDIQGHPTCTPILLTLVLSVFSAINNRVASQQDFISIDFGASEASYTDSAGIEWTNDVSQWPSISSSSVAFNVTPPPNLIDQKPFSTLRFFPNPSTSNDSTFHHIAGATKFCFDLPAVKGSFYLLRATFWLGPELPEGYPAGRTSGALSFHVIVDTYVGVLVNLSLPQTSVWFEEMYVRAIGSTVALCLSAASNSSDTPFINSLELRLLTDTMVTTKMVDDTGISLRMLDRQDFGAPSASPPFLRYPDDVFDRLWFRSSTSAANMITTNHTISTNTFYDRPPPAMLQTCYVASTPLQGSSLFYNVTTESAGSKGVTVAGNHRYFVNTWFSELDPRVNASGLRVFNVSTDGELFYDAVDVFDLAGNLYIPHGIYSSHPLGPYRDYFDIVAVAAPESLYPPTIAGVEILQLLDDDIATPTYVKDVKAIKDLIINLSGFNFSGDPCFPSKYNYPWINCSDVDDDIPRVISISLSNYNTASGKTIPVSLNDADNLRAILLDGNALEGSIPNLSNLQELQVLNLSNNKLNGSIPSSLADLPSLAYIDLRNNNLSGEIPYAFIEKQQTGLTFRYEGNPFLRNATCNCEPSTTSKSNTALIVGVVVGNVVFFILVLLIMLCACKRMRQQSNSQNEMLDSTPIQMYQVDDHVLRRTQIIELESINAHAFSFDEVMNATKNFSTVIGKGGFGFVYKGTLESGLDVAIKVLSNASRQGEREFLNEVALLSQIHHKNLVRLVGYCTEKKLILIYEYMSNGSLFDALFVGNNRPILVSWMERLCILLDAAQGLAYLHHGCRPQIIHRDVKSSNILLTENLEGKISDFGISRLKANDGDALTTNIVGSMGYIDPEFASTLRWSEKVDVYSFGIVILETLCGQPPLAKDPNKATGEIQLVEWVKPFYEKCAIEDIVDYNLGGFNVESVWKVLELAMACVQFCGERRPTMNEIYYELLEASRLECNSFPMTITSSYDTSMSTCMLDDR